MKKVIKKAKGNEYHLIGNLGIMMDGGSDSDYFKGKKLDEVFENVTKAKENAEKNLQNSKELFESYLQSVFANPGKDWEEKKIKEIYQ